MKNKIKNQKKTKTKTGGSLILDTFIWVGTSCAMNMKKAQQSFIIRYMRCLSIAAMRLDCSCPYLNSEIRHGSSTLVCAYMYPHACMCSIVSSPPFQRIRSWGSFDNDQMRLISTFSLSLFFLGLAIISDTTR